MGPLSQSTKFTSNPSIPTEEQHAAATLKIADFAALSDLGDLPYPDTNIWNHLVKISGNLGGYSSESDVNKHVCRVIDDILEALGIRGKVEIRAEVEVMSIRPDFMLILVNEHPIGTIEGKLPGKHPGKAMEHPNILGEVYDQLMHLRSIFRVDTPFAILTSYEHWRICWLGDQASIDRAGMKKLPPPFTYHTPVKSTNEGSKMELEDEPSHPSPPLPLTPSRAKGVGGLQKNETEESDLQKNETEESNNLGTEYGTRIFWGTKVMAWSDKSLPLLLASLIKKMMLAKQDTKPAVLRYANATTSAWKRAPNLDKLDFNLCISAAVKCFFLWEDLGHGADGKAFLVSGGTRGAVGVLKFFFTDPDKKARHEESMWKRVYLHLSPVATTVRTVQVMGQAALLMPWFQCPERTEENLEAVKKTLTNDFMGKGFRHDDVAWRNVGIYCQGGQTKAVVFDMQQVYCVENQNEDWVTPAVASLSKKLE
jgi:hypothetical protein